MSALRSMPEPHFLKTMQDDDDDTFGTTFSDIASQHAKPLLRECARGVGGGGGSGPMGTMGLPLSVLRSMPELVCTSNMGLRLLKKAGLPHPACNQNTCDTFLVVHVIPCPPHPAPSDQSLCNLVIYNLPCNGNITALQPGFLLTANTPTELTAICIVILYPLPAISHNVSLNCDDHAAGARAASSSQASLLSHLMHPLSRELTTTCIATLNLLAASPHDMSQTCDDTVTVLQPARITCIVILRCLHQQSTHQSTSTTCGCQARFTSQLAQLLAASLQDVSPTCDDHIKVLQPVLIPVAANTASEQEVHDHMGVVPQGVGGHKQLLASCPVHVHDAYQPRVLMDVLGRVLGHSLL